MTVSYTHIYTAWASGTRPKAVAARMTRRTLEYVASGLGNGDWQNLRVIPENQALVVLDAAMAKTNLGPQSRSNYRGYLRRLYRFVADAGIDLTPHNGQQLWPQMPQSDLARRARVAYDRFVQWAIGRGLWPGTVSSNDFLNWASVEQTAGNQHWRKDYTRLQSAWQALVADGSLPPLAFEPLPASLTSRFAIDPDNWPPHLRTEWQQLCLEASSPLRVGGMRAWRAVTKNCYERSLCRFLGWLRVTSPALDLTDHTWASLLTADRCREYLNWLVARSGKDHLNPGHPAFLRMVRGFHRFLLKSSNEIVYAFNDLARRCEVQERDKAARLVPFEMLQSGLSKLLDHVAAAARRGSGAGGAALATLQVDALVLGLLVTRALRTRNIREIHVGHNLIEADGRFFLRFKPNEMKGHRAFETTVSVELVPILRDYLHRGFQALAGRPPVEGDILLLNRRGQPLDASFGARVRKISPRWIGRSINPHLFRHIFATHAAQILRLTPLELAALLAHRSAQTCMKFYEITSPTLAAARFDDLRQAPANGKP